MDYKVTQAPTGGTRTNQYSSTSQQQAQEATDWQKQYSASNPTGYSSDRDFMVANSKGYWDYNAKRKQAYDSWLQGQQGQQSTQAPNNPTTSPGQAANNMAILQPHIQTQSQAQQAQQQAAQMTTTSAPSQHQPTARQQEGVRLQAEVDKMSPQQKEAYQTYMQNAQQQGGDVVQHMSNFVQSQQPQQRTTQQGGIINQQVGNMVDANGQITQTQGYDADQLGEAEKWNITGEQTMQGQLSSILSKDSAMMQLAETRALQQMADRGLSNSSLAQTAAQTAVIDTAMPIAQNDANTHAKAAGYNADITNQFSMQNVNWRNQALAFNADSVNAAGRTNAQNRTQTNIADKQNETTRWTAQLDADTRMNLGRMDVDVRRYIADQDVGVRRELGYLDASVRREDIGMRRELGHADIGVRRELGHLDAAVRREGLGVQRELGYLDASVKREGLAVQRELGFLDANTRTNIARMDNATQISVAQMGHEYQAMLQQSVNAQNMFANMSAQIATIDQANLSTQGKKNAIQRQMMITRDALNTMGQVSNVPNMSRYYSGGYVA